MCIHYFLIKRKKLSGRLNIHRFKRFAILKHFHSSATDLSRGKIRNACGWWCGCSLGFATHSLLLYTTDVLCDLVERADHPKVQSNSWLRSGVELSATVTSTSPQPNDRRGNVENVTLAKLVNGCKCDDRLGNRSTGCKSNNYEEALYYRNCAWNHIFILIFAEYRFCFVASESMNLVWYMRSKYYYVDVYVTCAFIEYLSKCTKNTQSVYVVRKNVENIQKVKRSFFPISYSIFLQYLIKF